MLEIESKKVLQDIEFLASRGNIAACIDKLKTLIQQAPTFEHFAKLLFYMIAHPEFSAKDYKECYQSFHSKYSSPLQKSSDSSFSTMPWKRLKIGYVSGDFCQHALARVISPLFKFHNPHQFEIFIYSNGLKFDAMSEWFQSRCHQWKDISRRSDQEILTEISSDNIDILVDLSGMTSGSRLSVFFSRLAPIQITAGLGVLSSTGIEAMDFRIADRGLVPTHLLQNCTESIVYLDHHLHWDPPQIIQQLPLFPPPVTTKGYITFGSSNRTYKLNDKVIQTWSEILKQVPNSKLSLKSASFEHIEEIEFFQKAFLKQGIEKERLIFTGQTSTPEHIAHNSSYDIALDPFPYQGGLTTFEALHMGRAVVTLDYPGGSRAPISILETLKQPNFIASNPEEYISLAINLANDIPLLIDISKKMRRLLLKSTIFNGFKYTKDIEKIYRGLWLKWCEGSLQEIKQEKVITAERLQFSSPNENSPYPSQTLKDYLNEALTSFHQGRFHHSEEVCKDILTRHTNEAEPFHILGLIAYQFNHFQAAAQLIQNAIKINPKSGHFHINLALIYRDSGQEHLFMQHINQALLLNPELKESISQMGITIT